MPNPLPPALLLLLAAPGPVAPPGGAAPKAQPRPPGWVMTQFTIRQRIIIRVPKPDVSRAPAAAFSAAPPPTPKVVEKKGPKCVPIDKLAGTGVARKDSVDLLMSDGTMLRAKLDDDCPALDFYAGMYLKPTPDGMLCGDRDAIRARSGRACPISSFKKLKLKH